MSERESELGVLQALEDGRIDVQEAVRRLEAVPGHRPGKPRRSHGWWLIPLAVGMALLGGGGMLGSLGGWWWLVAIPLLMLGTLLTVLAGASSTSPWVFVRVREGGARPMRIWVPIPVRAAAWGVQIARPWLREMDGTALDELLLTLERELGSQHDLVIDVDDVAGDERVRVEFE
jgi:hypothetical protein